ncbi:hypothetical protein NDU88_005106 [Pleurodeles waltl]|uniref:Uncharacterized protein n=1 Tax=Pleurodeles waltl TaxID=8319 RepID=A0AAV7QK87_PLEWA|nr:hypothetical protein NDU88_005106 [Pleurodeles waltl]
MMHSLSDMATSLTCFCGRARDALDSPVSMEREQALAEGGRAEPGEAAGVLLTAESPAARQQPTRSLAS